MPEVNTMPVQGSAPSLRSTAYDGTKGVPGGVYNLKHKYESKMDERFRSKSYTEAYCGHGYDWTGVNAITITTNGIGEIKEYDMNQPIGSRFGQMHEISDEHNTYQLSGYYAIRETYEALYTKEGAVRKEQTILKDIIDLRLKPMIDQYRLKKWADGAGNTLLVSDLSMPSTCTADTLDTTNVTRVMLAANAKLDNLDVPEEGRAFFMGITDATMILNLADELKYQQTYTEQGAINGAIKKIGKATVVAIPDKLMPAGAKVLCKWKGSTVDPRNLQWMQRYNHVEGYSGPVINGIYRWDSFVLAQKTNGILVIGDKTAAPVANPTATIASGTVTFACKDSDVTYHYTVGGKNPKVALNATTGVTCSAAVGDIVRVYATKDGQVASGISSYEVTSASKMTLLSEDEFFITGAFTG